MAAYAVSKLHAPRAARWLFYFFIGTLMIPGQIAIVPRFLLLSHFPWPSRDVPHIPFTDATFPVVSFVGTYWGVVLPAAFNAFNFLLLKGFFDTLPTDLIEAARIDGASEWMTLRVIMLPLARPVIAVCTYFAFTAAWNDFLGPLIYLVDQNTFTLSLGLQAYQSQQGGTPWPLLMAASLMVIAPVIVVFFFAQKVFIQGIATSGLKG